MTVHVSSARIKAIAHATEDPHKIARAFSLVYPEETFRPRIEKAVVKGHFGNPIMTLTLTISGHLAESFFSNLWSKLSRCDRETLIEDVGSQLDNQGRLHLRLDKQSCLLGTIGLKDQDPVKVEVSFRGYSDSKEQIRGFLRSIDEPAAGSIRR
jgi:RNA binding exosome subunit